MWRGPTTDIGARLSFLSPPLSKQHSGGTLNNKTEPGKHAREFARWLILRMLYAVRPRDSDEINILRVLQSFDFDCELEHVRQDIDYMAAAGLVQASQESPTRYRARLTTTGTALVEYNAPALSGIARPRRRRNSKMTPPRSTAFNARPAKAQRKSPARLPAIADDRAVREPSRANGG
jgi:hypothetical protein